MPLFTYKARSTAGDLVEGSMEVADRAAVVAQIGRQGMFPVTVEAEGQLAAIGGGASAKDSRCQRDRWRMYGVIRHSWDAYRS